jgi:DNA invertase Pin-like site-specific DNA recombinase
MSSTNNYHPQHGLSLKNSRFIAYLRPDAHRPLSQQRSEISRFCSEHGYNIVREYVDTEVTPGPVLQEALDHMQLVDGIVVSDLNRFVTHDSNRARDLRPLMKRFLVERSKHLIVIEEGIDTSTAVGQTIAAETINQLKDADEDANARWFHVGVNP